MKKFLFLYAYVMFLTLLVLTGVGAFVWVHMKDARAQDVYVPMPLPPVYQPMAPIHPLPTPAPIPDLNSLLFSPENELRIQRLNRAVAEKMEKDYLLRCAPYNRGCAKRLYGR